MKAAIKRGQYRMYSCIAEREQARTRFKRDKYMATEDITKTAGYKEAMEDVKYGRVYHADSVDDMFKQILG